MASLTVIAGPDRGKRFELTDPTVVIGRDVKNLVRLHDNETSRSHAEIRWTEKGHQVFDLKSSNGTYLNNQRVESGNLRTGDRIRIGQTELIFTAGHPGQKPVGDLASKVSVIGKGDSNDASAIVRSLKQSEAGDFLQHPERTESAWLQSALGNLSILYETSEAISRIADIDELLAHILDLVFESIKADHGCVMIKDADAHDLRPVAVRYAKGADSGQRITLSRTIPDWVMKHNEGVIVVNAAEDSRFRASQSVAQMGIREAICVPMRGRHDTLGVIYVDTASDPRIALKSHQPSKFTDDHLKLMMAISHQAGLALEDNRFYQSMMQAERLAAVGQTIAALSHHIKNILQGLRSGSFLVDMGLKDKNFDLLGKGWGIVEKNQTKIYNLVMDMLTYSKEREPLLEAADLNRIMAEIIELMEPRATELGVAIETKLDPKMPQVALDPEAIHRAVLNIVSNAIDACEGIPNAKVICQTSTDPREQFVWITISDTGCGISPENLEKIFHIFMSTKGSKGTGLGLAVSQKIVHEHAGSIRLTSTEGKGSKFIIELPLRKMPSLHETMPTQTMRAVDLGLATMVPDDDS